MAQLDFKRTSFPEMYERTVVGPLFEPWVETLFEKTALTTGQSVLDVACGTGIVSRLARERSGAASHIVGVDLSEPMLALARTIAPTVTFRAGNAMELPLDKDETFDVVICQQGIQFFPDRAKAVREMMRALKPGGRVAVAAWSPVNSVPLYQGLQNVVEQHVGAVEDQRYSFGNADALRALLADAGFQNVHAETMSRRAYFSNPEVFVRMNAAALVDMSAKSASLNEESRGHTIAGIVHDSADIVHEYREGDGMAFEVANIVGWAVAGQRA